MNNDMQKIIKRLQLMPHVEGGYYSETYKSDVTIEVTNKKKRSVNTAIYYLLSSGDFSCWHRLKSDEIWHYYCGGSLTIYQIDDDSKLSQIILGNPLTHENAYPQHIVPAGTWFAATVNEPNSFVLIGCTVAPGFDFEDFEIGKRNELLNQYPQHKNVIMQFTRDPLIAKDRAV